MRIPAGLSIPNSWLAPSAKTVHGQRLNSAASAPLGSLALCAIVVMLAVIGCGGTEEVLVQAKKAELETIEAETLTVTLRDWPTIVRSQGNLDADEQSVVGSEASGRVAEIHVDLGDFVRRGDPLITLDQDDARLLVVQAEAQLRQARAAVGLQEGMPIEKLDPKASPPVREAEAMRDEAKLALERSARLLQQNAIAQSEYDQADAAERVASSRYSSALNGVREKIATIGVRQAELSMRQQQLDNATVRAPFDGYVQQRNVALGTYVTVGQMIAVMVRTHPLRFRGTIPERHAQSLRVGQKVRLQIESVDQPRTAEITRISPTLSPLSRTLEFETEIANEDRALRSGLFAEAEVEIDPDAQAIVIPEAAVVAFAGTRKVWKVVDGVATEQPVVTTDRRGGQCRVVDGLEIGDVILVDGESGRVATVRSPSMGTASAQPPIDTAQPPIDTAQPTLETAQPTLDSTQRRLDAERSVFDDSTAELSVTAGENPVKPIASGSS
tara:strand:+ start:42 stop:1538 length:1497 start_codon:yes stop_codon:yes gene_type:complete